MGKRKVIGATNVLDKDDYNKYEDLTPTKECIQINDRQAPRGRSYARDDHTSGVICQGNIEVDPTLLSEVED
jgi:hypothetical protein